MRSAPSNLFLAGLRHAPAWAAALVPSAVAAGAVTLLLPAALASAVDAAVSGARPGGALAVLAALSVVLIAARAVETVAAAAYAARTTACLRGRVIRHVLTLDPARRRFATGDLLSRLTVDAEDPGIVLPAFVGGVIALATSAGAFVALALLEWRLAVAFLAGYAIALVPLRAFMRRATPAIARYRAAQAEIAGRLVDALAGARTIAAGGTLDRELARVLAPLPELGAAGQDLWEAQRRLSWQAALLLAWVQAAVLAMAGVLVADGALTPGGLLAAAVYVELALRAVDRLDGLMVLARARIGAARLSEVLQESPALAATPAPLPLPDGPGALELRSVTVRSPDGVVLDRVDLAVPAGTTMALVGASGAGKSTLAALAGRLADPDEGSVLLDGVPLADVAAATARAAVAYAFERPQPVGTTIAGLIALGRPDAPRAEVEAAARAAQADGFIGRLPAGYGTLLRDAPLSGGELQRLGLAQAVLQTARVVVLDDATSSLDSATEQRVVAAFEPLLRDRTSLIVAHRASSAARADAVAWLEHGRVRAVGRHADLWRDPSYRAVFGVAEPAYVREVAA